MLLVLLVLQIVI